MLQIILARILSPEHYGMLSLMIIFTTLANVFIQTGFNTALIQKKDVTEEDYSSVFWVSLGIAVLIYVVIFFSAPFVADFYAMPEIISPLRVLSLMLFPGAFNSIQLAIVSKAMDFKKVFYSNVGGILISGTVGIIIAVSGGGVWALVAQTMLNIFVACFVMFLNVRWRPKLVCDFNRVGNLLKFGWKLLVSSLLDTLYQDLRSLVIGRKYDSGTLGYYNRGKQFPQFIINAVNGTVQSVMLPAMSAEQDDIVKVKTLTRNSIMISSYIIFPLMAGLAGISVSLITLLLTDKWLPAVPYMQIYCFSLAFYPVHSCNLQAMNALGRSDLFLKLEIIKKTIGIIALVIAVFCFDSPFAIAMTGVFTTVISCFINASPNKKLIDYSYFEQMRDIMPSLLAAVTMLVGVLLIEHLPFGVFATMLLQIIAGVILYVTISILFKIEPFRMLLGILHQQKKGEQRHE